MISVICSVRNGSRHLSKYLQSLNGQTLANFEVLFLDAASEDNSIELIEGFDFRPGISIRVFKSLNILTVYESWNALILASKGDWTINYNVDDFLFPESLSILSQFTHMYPRNDVFYSPCFLSQSLDHNTLDSYRDWPDANLVESHIQGCCCGPFPLLKKSTLYRYGLFNERLKISGDYDLWCRLYANNCTFYKLSLPLGIYYLNPQGLSTNNQTEQLRNLEDNIARKNLIV